VPLVVSAIGIEKSLKGLGKGIERCKEGFGYE